MQKKEHIHITILVIVVLILAAAAGNVFYFNIDLTESGIHSISKEFIDSIQGTLEAELSISYYRSDKLQQYAAFPHQIEDELRKFESALPGLSIHIEDPEGREQYMNQLGIRAKQLELPSYNETIYFAGYSGIHFSYKDKSAVIPYIEDVYQLEYRIASTIKYMLNDDILTIAFYSAGEGQTYQDTYQGFYYALQDIGVLKPLVPGDTIPFDTDVLIVSSGVVLNSDDIRNIDAYTGGGGNTLFFVDGLSVSLIENFRLSGQKNPQLIDLLKHYGMYPQEVLLADLLSKQLPVDRDVNGQTFQQLQDYYYWPLISPANVNANHPVSKYFSGLELYWASPLAVRQDADVLFTSTRQSWLDIPYAGLVPGSVLPGQTSGEEYILGAAYEGVIEPFFARSDSESDATDSRILVVGDSDFISDLHLFDNGDYNRDFLKNAVEWAGGEEMLLAIRNKAVRDVRLNALPADSMVLVFQSTGWWMTVILPLVIIIIAFFRFYLRRKKSNREAE